ncbi:FHA domain-containing protein [Dictyobacter arantiisoli]|uniref:YscD cytoplasmic domain-containing protein n=1 Tax=Dictyobacter arantiisoli TaxID=2014874 RepID=A0A5A5TET4_9CHLR|nr:FHA domain-containing protein [Dictyobacter arantiisoli]GCF09735.1 hypothetical protein KDI_32990 [Dictyobacter arantiisoli]
MQFTQFVLQYQGREYPLDKPQIIIGSDPRCDIRIENNPQVLPMHAQVISQAGQVFLQYMQRGAAVWVNDSPASQQALRDQDEIALGNRETRLKLQLNRNPTGVNQQVNWTNPTPTVQNTTGTQMSGTLNTGGMRTPDSAYQSGLLATTPPQAQAPTATVNSTGLDTTRYLCAAGHLDEDSQDYVMRNVIYEERKSLGESYGVNMPLVVSWCKAGINRINVRDMILSGLLGLVCLGYFLVINVIVGYLSRLTSASSSPSSYGYGYGSSYSAPSPATPSPLVTIIGGLFTIVLALIILVIAFNIEKWITRRWPKSHPGIVTYIILLLPFSFMGLIIVPLLWGIILVELLVRYYGNAVKQLRKDTFNPRVGPVSLDRNLSKKLQENFVTSQRNVIAYSGYKPFAGAGEYKGGWSFVIDTSKGAYDTSKFATPSQRQPVRPFTISSLYDKVEKDVWALGVKNVLEIEGKLYVRGEYLPEQVPFFNAETQRPMTSVNPDLVAQYKEHPTEDVRYYQCLRFSFWRGEMIFTAYLRFVKRGKDLFTEINYVLLPPMHPDYYWVDRREITPPLREIWQLYLRSLDKPVQTWLGAPFRLARSRVYAAQQRKLARVASNNPAFDYGASTSLRQFASDDGAHLFFQELDEQMYLKMVEKQILETISNFLDAHQIDTSELIQRQQTILNDNTVNNLTFNGEVSNSGSMTIGAGSQINNSAPA